MARTTRGIDVRRFAEAIKGHGIDLRHWASHGTVCTVDDSGNCNFSDPDAVIVAPDGVWADVVLQPLEIPVTARMQLGVGGGTCTILCPLRAGDEVLVIIPDGDLNNPPAIVAILNSQGVKIPLESDGRPVFKNDRLSIFAKGVPIEIRTDAGNKVHLQTDGDAVVEQGGSGKVRLGGDGAAESVIKGDTYRLAERTFLTALDTYVSAIQGIADPPGLVTIAVKAAITAFKAADNLSGITKTG